MYFGISGLFFHILLAVLPAAIFSGSAVAPTIAPTVAPITVPTRRKYN